MSAPVDVLAAMEEAHRHAEERGNIIRSSNLREARAAVTELVAAARKALPRKLHNDRPEDARLRAALAKFGGAKWADI